MPTNASGEGRPEDEVRHFSSKGESRACHKVWTKSELPLKIISKCTMGLEATKKCAHAGGNCLLGIFMELLRKFKQKNKLLLFNWVQTVALFLKYLAQHCGALGFYIRCSSHHVLLYSILYAILSLKLNMGNHFDRGKMFKNIQNYLVRST